MEQTNSTDFAISVSNLSKSYIIGKERDSSFKNSFSNLFKNNVNKTEFIALQNVTFEIKRGDVLGIIGDNGAGKSTLLKILSQITKPSQGKIEINGRIASLLEVGTGFHPELTGRENIYLNGTLLGMTRKEVKSKFNEIVEFSGVEKFIDTPVKHYSSGMYVRLAFAVAAHLEPEILIIDEVLAVGDAEFQKKCLGKMKDVASHGRTVIFVSHNLSAVKNLCTKGIFLEKGRIIAEGEINEVVDFYLNKNNSYLNESQIKPGFFNLNNEINKYGILSVELFCDNKPTNTLLTGSQVEMKFNFLLNEKFKEPVLGIVINDLEGTSVLGINNRNTGDDLRLKQLKDSISICFPEFRIIKQNTYSVDIYFGDRENNVYTKTDAFYFNVMPSKPKHKPFQINLNYFYDSSITFK